MLCAHAHQPPFLACSRCSGERTRGTAHRRQGSRAPVCQLGHHGPASQWSLQHAQQRPCPSDVLREPRLCPLSCCLSPRPAASSVLGRDEEWVSGSIHAAEEARRSLVAVTSPLGGIMGQKVSWQQAVRCGGEDLGAARLFPSPSQRPSAGCLLQP